MIKDQERTDVSDQVDFDVNSTRQADIISVLGGETLDSKKVILPAGDGITKSRIRYLVTLLEADSLLPREKKNGENRGRRRPRQLRAVAKGPRENQEA